MPNERGVVAWDTAVRAGPVAMKELADRLVGRTVTQLGRLVWCRDGEQADAAEGDMDELELVCGGETTLLGAYSYIDELGWRAGEWRDPFGLLEGEVLADCGGCRYWRVDVSAREGYRGLIGAPILHARLLRGEASDGEINGLGLATAQGAMWLYMAGDDLYIAWEAWPGYAVCYEVRSA